MNGRLVKNKMGYIFSKTNSIRGQFSKYALVEIGNIYVKQYGHFADWGGHLSLFCGTSRHWPYFTYTDKPKMVLSVIEREVVYPIHSEDNVTMFDDKYIEFDQIDLIKRKYCVRVILPVLPLNEVNDVMENRAGVLVSAIEYSYFNDTLPRYCTAHYNILAVTDYGSLVSHHIRFDREGQFDGIHYTISSRSITNCKPTILGEYDWALK